MNNAKQLMQAVKKANDYNKMSSFRKEQYAIALDEINELKDKIIEVESANQRIRKALCQDHFDVMQDQQLKIEKLEQRIREMEISNELQKIKLRDYKDWIVRHRTTLKCCGNCIYYEEHNGYCKGEWDKNKRHLCQLWRAYNG